MDYLKYVIIKCDDNEELIKYFVEIDMDTFIDLIGKYINRRNRSLFFQYKDIKDRLFFLNKKNEKRMDGLDNNE